MENIDIDEKEGDGGREVQGKKQIVLFPIFYIAIYSTNVFQRS